MFLGYIWMSQERVSETKGKVIPCWQTENRKGTGTKSGESGARNPEAESIRSGAESARGRVKFKTVTEIRWSSGRDTFTAESVYLVLNSMLDWEPVEKLKERCDVVSFTLGVVYAGLLSTDQYSWWEFCMSFSFINKLAQLISLWENWRLELAGGEVCVDQPT